MIKYLLILVAATIFGGCAASHSTSSFDLVTLQFRDSTVRDVYLLQVHDNALLVSTVNPCGARTDSVAKHTVVIPFQSVAKIYKENRRSFIGTYIPSLVEMFQTKRAFRVNAFGQNLSALFDAAKLTASYFLSKPFTEYELGNEHDVQLLQSDVAAYPATGTDRFGAGR